MTSLTYFSPTNMAVLRVGCINVRGLGSPWKQGHLLKEFFKANSIEVLAPWPGNSPDLNPIENLWAILKKQVDKRKPTNCKQLQTLIQYEWSSIHSELINKLVSSMPKRFK